MSNNYRIKGFVEINKDILNDEQFDNVITILEAVAPNATEDNDMYRFWYTHDSEYGGKNSLRIMIEQCIIILINNEIVRQVKYYD